MVLFGYVLLVNYFPYDKNLSNTEILMHICMAIITFEEFIEVNFFIFYTKLIDFFLFFIVLSILSRTM